MRVEDLYDLNHSIVGDRLNGIGEPWEALSYIEDWIMELGPTLDSNEYYRRENNIWIHRSVKIAKSAEIIGPAIIGENSEIGHSAYLRAAVLIGKNVVVGNSTELKNVILFDNVMVPHYNYVGDSILGYMAHMGAGAITSNVKGSRESVVVHLMDGGAIDTHRMKVGAFLGDYAEIGCNSVLNPGTIVGRQSQVYPLSSVRGEVASFSIYKDSDHIIKKEKR